MRAGWIAIVPLLAAPGTADAQELRGLLTVEGRPGYLTNAYLDPALPTWDTSRESLFGTGGVVGVLELGTDRLSASARAGARALTFADSARTWWSGLVGGDVEWRVGSRLRIGAEGAYSESGRPGRRTTLWGHGFLRWDVSTRARLSIGPALARTGFPEIEASGLPDPPGLPGLGPAPRAAPSAETLMGLARVEVWPGSRWRVRAEAFAVRTDAEDLDLEYTGGGASVRLTRWLANAASLSLGVGGEGFGYRAALEQPREGSDELPEDDAIWRAELDARWPVSGPVELVTRLAGLYRPGTASTGSPDMYASLGLAMTFGGALSSPERGLELWEVVPEGVRVRVPYDGSGRLYLVGDFNAWAARGLPLREAGSVHSATIPLEPGIYRYRIRVVDGTTERWLDLPDGAASEDDGFGGRNGVIVVPETVPWARP